MIHAYIITSEGRAITVQGKDQRSVCIQGEIALYDAICSGFSIENIMVMDAAPVPALSIWRYLIGLAQVETRVATDPKVPKMTSEQMRKGVI